MMFLALILFGVLSYLCIKAFLNLRQLKNSDSPEVKKRKKNAVVFGCIGLFGTWVCLGDVRHSINDYFRSNNQMEYQNTPSNTSSYSEPTTTVSDSKTCSWCSKSFSGKHYTHLGKMAPCQSSTSESSIGKYCSMKCCSEARKSTCPTCR